MLDLSLQHIVKGSKYYLAEINQLYHPTGKFGQDSQDIVYSDYRKIKSKFLPVVLKEWFYLVELNGHLIIDYIPDNVWNFRKIEESMFWLWKSQYDICFHGPILEAKASSMTVRSMKSFIESIDKTDDSQITPLYPPKNYRMRFVCRKIQKTIIPGDSIDKWSFGIITNGKRKDWINLLINSIRAQKIQKYEIIICGTYYDRNEKDISYIPFNKRDDLGWITRKKNIIAENAKYENICIMHDRAVLSKDWFIKTKKYGNCFEIMCNRQTYGDKRAYDWTTLCGPYGTNYKLLMLDYRDWDYWSFIGGLQLITKRTYLLNIRYNEAKFWNDQEDTDLSFRYRDQGYISRINDASILSLGFRHGLIPSRPFNKKFYIPDMILRRIMREIARVSLNIPIFHKFLELFCSTSLYKKIVKIY